MALLFVLIAFLAIILIRAAAFKPMKEINAKREMPDIDKDKAVRDLADMVRCKTISDINDESVDINEFEKFRNSIEYAPASL